jgi:hypothetical protein
MPDDVNPEAQSPTRPGAALDPAFAHRSAVATAAWQTRRQREAERKARLIREREEREANERLVLSMAAGGKSLREISRSTHIPFTTVRRLHAAAIDGIAMETREEFAKLALDSLNHLKAAAWAPAMAGKPDSQRVALEIQKEINKIGGIYPPAQTEVDLTVQVTRRQTVSRAAAHLAQVRDRRMRAGAIDVEVVEPSTNGHNGHANGNGAGYTELAS